MEQLSMSFGRLAPIAVITYSVLLLCAGILLYKKSRTICTVFSIISLIMLISFLVIRPLVVESYYIATLSMDPTVKPGSLVFCDKLAYRFHRIERQDAVFLRAPADDGTVYIPPQGTLDRMKVFLLASDPREIYLKRVVGLPGDMVQIRAPFLLLGRDKRPAELKDIPVLAELLRSAPASVDRDVITFGDKGSLTAEQLSALLGTGVEFAGGVYVNGRKLNEPYTKTVFPDATMPNPSLMGMYSYASAGSLEASVVNTPTGPAFLVPQGCCMVLGDNRENSEDSRDFGFIPLSDIVGKQKGSIYLGDIL